MTSAVDTIDLFGVAVDIETRGAGRDILYLHGGMWFAEEAAFAGDLARLGRVLTPVHPGFDGRKPPPRFTSADDLAYVYLDLIDRLALKNVLIVASSFGGWVAAELTTKSCAALGGLVLIDPFGVKTGDRESRDIVDLFATPDGELKSLAWRDPSRFNDVIASLSDDELARRVRAREALARYGWQPYMHDPRLPGRLHRITKPTLFLWGAEDRIVTPDYGRAYAALVPGARFRAIENAGHFPHLEQTSAVMDAIAAFARENG